jgi:hypothetical protein
MNHACTLERLKVKDAFLSNNKCGNSHTSYLICLMIN